MTNSLNPVFRQFIQFGRVADKRERTKITELIQQWQFMPIHQSNIEKKYLAIINVFVTDTKINTLLKVQPNMKTELVKQLFKLLEKLEMEVTAFDDSMLQRKLEAFKEMPIEDFDYFINQKNPLKKHLIQTYPKDALDVQALSSNYKKLINNQINNARVLEKQINELQQALAEKKQLEKKHQAEMETLKNKEGKLKIVGKIDLKTGKPIPYTNPDDIKIEQISEQLSDIQIELELLNEDIANLKTELRTIQQDQNVFENLKNEFATNWKHQIDLKRIKAEIEQIDVVRKSFLEQLYEKIDDLMELLKLLKPFVSDSMDYGRLWDLSKGNFHKINFKLLSAYAKVMEKRKELQELAELLGRYRRAEVALEEEEFEQIETFSKYKIQHSGKSELVGITESNDLNNLLPTEIALFSDLQTESIFFKRFAEKQLQTFQYINKARSFEQKSTTQKRQKEVEKDKGPFIIAVDTSGSMHGTPEQLAKVIAFAITKIAIKDKRKAFLISFSTEIETFELTDIHNSLPKLVTFLEKSFRGGTDVSDAVRETVKQMQSEHYEKADLLIISDGIFGHLPNTILKMIEDLKQQGNQFNALMIGASYNKNALQFCDSVWQYDSNQDSLKDLVKKIKTTCFSNH